jgi:hypothetical protein
MQKDVNQSGEMAEKVVLLPDASPRQVEEHGAHDGAYNNEQSAKDPVHE